MYNGKYRIWGNLDNLGRAVMWFQIRSSCSRKASGRSNIAAVNFGFYPLFCHLHLFRLDQQFLKSWKQFILFSKVRILERVESDLWRLVNKGEALTLNPLSDCNTWHTLQKGTPKSTPEHGKRLALPVEVDLKKDDFSRANVCQKSEEQPCSISHQVDDSCSAPSL